MFNGVATVYDELIHPLVSGDHEEMENDGILRKDLRQYSITNELIHSFGMEI
jgi:hypothetical protein